MAAVPISGGTAATVTVNLASVKATVGPDLMGIHTSVYDGTMQAPTTPDLLKAAGVTSLRYPGGSYADLYHWETHTGTPTPAAGAGSNTIYVAPGADFGSFIGLLDKVGAKAMITVNYGMNPAGTGPGVPQEAAAWVAYANGSPTSTTVIGLDADGVDWMTVGYWAGLRAAMPLPVDDGKNFLRIGRATPVGIKYWEIGNEIYGNGYYYGNATSAGWEADLHAPYNGTNGTARNKNAALGPATYGMNVKAYAQAMKAVDPNVHIGVVLHWPFNEFTATQGVVDWNNTVLPQACSSVDFVINHWYPGTTLASLLTLPKTDIPAMFTALRGLLTMASNNCGTKGATMPIAVTEWGPNTGDGAAQVELKAALRTSKPPMHTQLVGIFAAESYANFMEQNALAVHWLELHNDSYLGNGDTGSPTDVPVWGYYGQQMAHHLAGAGDQLVTATVSNAGSLMTSLLVHAAKKTDGSVSVMLTNTTANTGGGNTAANVTVNVSGGNMLNCVGTKYVYAPVGTDLSGTIKAEAIFSAASRTSFSVGVPAYSVVVVNFPKP